MFNHLLDAADGDNRDYCRCRCRFSKTWFSPLVMAFMSPVTPSLSIQLDVNEDDADDVDDVDDSDDVADYDDGC